jgi:hypothetical protein
MKQQTETIEYMAERRIIEKHQTQSEYKGCKFICSLGLVESSIGMKTTRVSDIGRRLGSLMADDDREL